MRRAFVSDLLRLALDRRLWPGLLALWLIASAAGRAEAEGQYYKTTVSTFSTTSTTFTPVTGSLLQFTPTSASEVWVLLFSAGLGSASTAETAAEVQYTVNGVAHGMGGTMNSAANGRAPWQHFYRVTGTTSQQTVEVQLRDATGAGATITNLQVIAFMMPANADFRYTETEGIRPVATGWATYETLSFTPPTQGDYLVAGLANAHGASGTTIVGVRMQDTAGFFWPWDTNTPGTWMQTARSAWQSFFLTREVVNQSGLRTFRVQANGSAAGAEIRYSRIMAFRTDAFASHETNGTGGEQALTNTLTSLQFVQAAKPPSARDYVVIQSQVVRASADASRTRNVACYRNGALSSCDLSLALNDANYWASFGGFDALTTSRLEQYDNMASKATGGGFSAFANEITIHVLGLPKTATPLQVAAGTGVPTPALCAPDGRQGYYFRITAPSSFEMIFDTGVGGGIGCFFDLAEDPGKRYDLAGGENANAGVKTLSKIGLFDGTKFYSPDDNHNDTSLATWSGSAPRLDLLEATSTRVRLREETFFQEQGTTAIFAGAKAFYDYTVYPTGKMGVRQNRRTTAATASLSNSGVEMSATNSLAPDPRANNFTWCGQAVGCSYGNPIPPGTDDFLLAQREKVSWISSPTQSGGVRTDLLDIMYKDWTAANGYVSTVSQLERDNTGNFMTWRNNTVGALPAPPAVGSNEVWNHLFYFKPTNFTSFADPAVTGRSSDYRTPAALTITKGSHWVDAAENSAADDFNESEGAYVLNLDPTPGSEGTTFSIDGTATNRYSPFFKVRQWRSVNPPDPNLVKVAGVALKRNIDYRADVKPLSRAHFATNVLWHSTLQSAAAVTAPDVGGGGTVNGGTTFVAGRYGNGANFAGAGANVSIPVGPDFDKTAGAVEFWYQPTYAHNDGVTHVLWHNSPGAGVGFALLKQPGPGNELNFVVNDGTTSRDVAITAANYSWRARDWVHIRAVWNDGAMPELWVNGVRLPHTDTGPVYNAAAMAVGSNFIGTDSGGGNSASGVIDEFTIYGGSSPTSLAEGGLTSSTVEYLGDPSRNFTLSLSGVSATGRRGRYLYLATDSKFRGLNFVLGTAGTGVAATAIDWEYWDGTTWASLRTGGVGSFGFTDTTNSMTTAAGSVSWTSDPTGWSTYSVNGGPDLYYVRAHLPNGAAYTTAPVEAVVTSDILLYQYFGDVTANMTFDLGPAITTAIELASFEATGTATGIDLAWTTATEIDNLGFHLYRALSSDGPWERITTSVIPGLGGSVVGRSYAYSDSPLTAGVTYFYRLEDIDLSGRTESHGPVSAVAGVPPSGGGPPPVPDPPRGTYGDPSSVTLRELERSPRHVVLELATGGFTATPEGDGYYRVRVPGFESASKPGEPSLPMRRAFVEAIAGKRVRLVSIQPSDELRFPGLRPVPEGTPAIEVDDEGSVMPARKANREGRAFRALFPAESARLMGTSFQGETKKAQVLLFPLRWDGSGLVLSRRLVVRLDFEGRQADETPLGGSRGRSRIDRSSHARRGVLATITVHDRGLYRVDYDDVFPAGGREPRGLSPSSLRLSRQGEAVAYRLSRSVFGPGSSLYFVTEGASLNPYADAVYELETDASGLLMGERTLAPSAPAAPAVAEYLETVRREENYYYQSGLLEAPDLWLWDLAVSPGSSTTTFTAAQVSGYRTPGRLHVVLQGGSDVPGVVDHHVRVKVNGVLVGETTFDGAREQVLDVAVPEGVFVEGTNTLTLENVGDTGAGASMVFLNRYSVSYPRNVLAVQGKLEGRFEATGRATIQGASLASFVLDTTGATPQWLTGATASLSGLTLPVEAGHRYVVAANALRPTVKPLSPSTLRSPLNQADYLLLGPQAFLSAAQPLLAFRQAEGLTTKAVSLEEVYEQFGHGEVSPQAIKDFLEYAYHSWSSPSLRYVLLLGDASYDPKNYLGTGTKDWLPGYPVVTSYIQTVSDPGYASVNGNDSLPDIAIGRLPAASAAEAAVLVQKVLDFENGGGSLAGAAVLVADNADLAGNFEADADDVASTVLASRSPQKIYLSVEGANTRTRIRQAFDNGASFMNYIGHGSTVAWASENFFNYTDVPALLPQSQQPLLLTLNCLNGFFHFPPMNSLSEALLKAQGKGVVAAFSPTGLSVNDPAHVFHKAVLQEILSGSHARIGDAILAAQDDYAQTGAFPELLSIYHLFGDPALRIR
jgi:Peptidase family C25